MLVVVVESVASHDHPAMATTPIKRILDVDEPKLVGKTSDIGGKNAVS